MNIFDVVDESFFKPLTSTFKVVYMDCLTIIYNTYRSELSYDVDRENVVGKLIEYFEQSNISDITFEDETDVLKDSRTKAMTFLRKLKEYGWVEYEVSSRQVIKVAMPDHAVAIIKCLIDVSNPREVEYQSEIAMIYSALTNEELLNRPYPQILRPVYERTRVLFDELKKLNTGIKKYIEELTADRSPEDVMKNFIAYQDEIGGKAYHRIKTEENISRYRSTIVNRLKTMLNDPDIFERTVIGYQNIEQENDTTIAEEKVREQIMAIIDSFHSYNEIVKDIDRKHAKYLRNAVERAKFLLLNTNNIEGKISLILQYMAEYLNQEELTNITEDAPDDICNIFNIFHSGHLSNESLKTIPVSRKITEVEVLFDQSWITEEERANKRIAIYEKNRNRFTKKNVEEYVIQLLLDKKCIRASSLPIESKRDMIRIMFIHLYGRSTRSKYIVVPKEEIITRYGFRFRDFDIRKR